jgi:hypothetical protein
MTHGDLAVILQSHGMRVRSRGRGFQAQCPAHPDERRKRALSIGLGAGGRQILHCHAGCTFDEVRAALGLPVEAFFGWQPYNLKRSRGSSPASSVTLMISGIEILHAKKLLAGDLNGELVVVALPPRARHVTRAVAADMALIFALADEAGVGDVPLMHSTHWAARRLGLDMSGVAHALRALVQHGAIKRAKSVPAWNGRATRTYRRAER